MAELVYALCAITSALCALLLIRSFRRQRLTLLLWTGVGFAGLAIASLVLFVDLVLVPEVDLSALRALITAVSMGACVIGLVWSSRAKS